MLTIRAATPADHAVLCQIAKQSRYTKDFSNRVMFSSDAAYAKGWIQVAELEGRAVGFYCIREKSRTPETVLYFITVDRDSKRSHVGLTLIQHILDNTRHRCLALNVAKENVEARGFYERLGFLATGESLNGTGLRLERRW